MELDAQIMEDGLYYDILRGLPTLPVSLCLPYSRRSRKLSSFYETYVSRALMKLRVIEEGNFFTTRSVCWANFLVNVVGHPSAK